MIRSLLIIIISLLLCYSCLNPNSSEENIPVAKVYDKFLYQKNLKKVAPEGLSDSDSLAFVQAYIDTWIRKQLILHKAELSLLEEDKDVQQQIDDYRTSLLIFKYEQNYIKQKLDTLITDEEIKEYYEKNSSNFILNTPIIKGLYLKVPRSAPETWRVKRYYRSKNSEDFPKLEQYAFEHAEEFEYFEDNWIQASSIISQLPKITYSTENLLRWRKNFETKDSTYIYLLKLSECKFESDVAPLEYVQEKIISILLNKRKIQLINKLESDIYNDALNRANFNTF